LLQTYVFIKQWLGLITNQGANLRFDFPQVFSYSLSICQLIEGTNKTLLLPLDTKHCIFDGVQRVNYVCASLSLVYFPVSSGFRVKFSHTD